MMQFIVLAAQQACFKDKIDAGIQRVLSHGQHIMGPEVQELEEKLVEYVGVEHAITCANVTFTFYSTAEVVAYEGVTRVFIDSDEATFNICPIGLENRIQETFAEGKLIPKAIIAVDLFELPANYPEIQKNADKYNLKLVEDVAQGFGESINGLRVGSFGDIATTRFFSAKPLGCCGDSGVIFTNNDERTELLKSYRIYGKGSGKYDNVRIGMNSRLDTIRAAILLEKLADFPAEIVNRNNAAGNYEKTLAGKYKTPQVPKGYISSWAQYALVSDNRDAEVTKYKAQCVLTMIYYDTCMHQQTVFNSLGYVGGDLSVAEKLANVVFSLPMSGYLDSKNVIMDLL